jgi:glucose/arabinose dehydrogenase
LVCITELTHNVDCSAIFELRREMRRSFIRTFLPVAFLALPPIASGQITHGQKPNLPPPFATPSAGNGPDRADAPEGFLPTVPAGFHVNIFAKDFKTPRWLAVAPNGDIFVAETGADRVDILRDPNHAGGAQQREVFASGLERPFGIAFHDDYVYVGDTNAVLRFRYDPKTSKRLSEAEKLKELPTGGHWTRSLAFTPDGKHLLISVGSAGNVETDDPPIRAAVSVCDLDGKNCHQYATGLRNPVGLAINPVTDKIWVGVNERDDLGDNLPPDYFTSLKEGGFYGWPYSYIGSNLDPRVHPQRPDLVAKAIIPDVLLGPHVAPLQFTFYSGKQFPKSYWGGAFIAEHGSWNRSTRSGYQVAFVAFKDGEPSENPVPFLTGFVPDPTKSLVYGRPVGVTTLPDGSLLVSDDGMGIIYQISYSK